MAKAPNNLQATTKDLMALIGEESRKIFNPCFTEGNNTLPETYQIHRYGQCNNLAYLDKIPDIVKGIKHFSVLPNEVGFSSWKYSVKRILNLYDHLKDTPKYYGILTVIRGKIVDNADNILNSYRTPLNWNRIIKCLNMQYADDRDIGTLKFQMISLIQKNERVTEFYNKVYRTLFLIFDKQCSMEMS
jgi:hypothetical protein